VKVGIVIPFKSKKVAKDWDVACENLNATVDSVLNQKSCNYRAVVVGHDQPEFFEDEHYTESNCPFLYYTDFPPPEAGEDEAENQLKYEFDRCSKILRGIMHLKGRFPDISHWFALDADDLIHDEFISCISEYESADAIILENGYFYFKSTGIINKENEFSAYCGSSAIISDKYFYLPEVFGPRSFKTIPFGGISHVHMKQKMLERGANVVVPDERLIMYVRDNGENISNDAYCNAYYKKLKKFIKMLIRFRFLKNDLRAHFGM